MTRQVKGLSLAESSVDALLSRGSAQFANATGLLRMSHPMRRDVAWALMRGKLAVQPWGDGIAVTGEFFHDDDRRQCSLDAKLVPDPQNPADKYLLCSVEVGSVEHRDPIWQWNAPQSPIQNPHPRGAGGHAGYAGHVNGVPNRDFNRLPFDRTLDELHHRFPQEDKAKLASLLVDVTLYAKGEDVLSALERMPYSLARRFTAGQLCAAAMNATNAKLALETLAERGPALMDRGVAVEWVLAAAVHPRPAEQLQALHADLAPGANPPAW